MNAGRLKRYHTGLVIGAAMLAGAFFSCYLYWLAAGGGLGQATKGIEIGKELVLQSRLAGTWYPQDAAQLREQINPLFEKANPQPLDNVIALILPHAGYMYSGQTAAMGLKTLRKNYSRIVVIGPSHNPYLAMEDVLSVPMVTHYETPLGRVALDTEFINQLLKDPAFQSIPGVHEDEHSVQIEVPLLQCCQENFKLVPIVAGTCSPQQIRRVAAILSSLLDQETLVIASSDFTHYGPRYGYVPFKEDVPEQLEKLDAGAYERIAAINCQGFLEYRQRTGTTICGYVPIAILLAMLDKSTQAHLVYQTNSGKIMGDFQNAVGYLSVAFCGKWQVQSRAEPVGGTVELTEQDKQRLLVLARGSLQHYLDKQQVPDAADVNVGLTAAMTQPAAAFVTLKKNSMLRGCIGDIFAQRPLYKSVIINAILAGLKDSRFPPVTRPECEQITIEISVLTRPEPAESADKIRVGVDGVVLSKNGHRAVFLPHVATEQGWDRAQMLSQLSLKAGLPADAWKQGAEFLVFQAVVFGEKDK